MGVMDNRYGISAYWRGFWRKDDIRIDKAPGIKKMFYLIFMNFITYHITSPSIIFWISEIVKIFPLLRYSLILKNFAFIDIFDAVKRIFYVYWQLVVADPEVTGRLHCSTCYASNQGIWFEQKIICLTQIHMSFYDQKLRENDVRFHALKTFAPIDIVDAVEMEFSYHIYFT